MKQDFGTEYEDEAWAIDWWRVAGWVFAFIVSTLAWLLLLKLGQPFIGR